jgi:hypothetical protein
MGKNRFQKLNVKKKVNPIVREHDNSTDLEIAEMKAHARVGHFRAPDLSVPGTDATAPPFTPGTIPG